MYQNLFGNKLLDFSESSRPFRNFNSIFASTGQDGKGSEILARTRMLDESRQKFRVCIVSQIAGGERRLTEVWYDLSTG